MICCPLISRHISTTLPARNWSENGMVQTNFNYYNYFNSLKAEDVLDVLSAGFLKTTKVLECLQNENGEIFPRSTLG